MSNIIDFLTHKNKAEQLLESNALALSEKLVSELFDSFSMKWPIKANKIIWVPYWASVIHGAGIDPKSLKFASRLCLDEDTLPTVFFFVHICGLYSDFKTLD